MNLSRFSFPSFLKLGALLCLSSLALAAALSIPANGDFEDGLSGWLYADTMSRSVPEAAFTGKQGLRVTDNDSVNGSSLYSSGYTVAAGQTVTLSFQARSSKTFLAVYLWPMDAAGRAVKDPARRGDGMHAVAIKESADWQPYSITAAMPAGTVAVSIWVHSWSSGTGTADFDDFKFDGIVPDSTPLKTAAEMASATEALLARGAAKASEEVIPAVMPTRAAPPIIILKLDDLRQINGNAHQLWTRVSDYLAARKIKCGLGIICETLQEATPAYIEWIRKRHDSGLVEFWFHGWDHQTWTDANGKKISEFGGRDFEEQWSRFARSQALAKEKLGFSLVTFGPGGGGSTAHQTEVTAEVMVKDPDMKVWLYPSPIDNSGRKLATAGKITILDRLWAVNLEAAVGQPNYARFVAGYARNPDREYFVLQGHPGSWGNERFAEFEKIIDFLVEQKAVFMTPSDYAASLKGKPAQQFSGK